MPDRGHERHMRKVEMVRYCMIWNLTYPQARVYFDQRKMTLSKTDVHTHKAGNIQ